MFTINFISIVNRLFVEALTPEQISICTDEFLSNVDLTIVVGARIHGDWSTDAQGQVIGEGYLYTTMYGEQVIFNG